MVGGKKMPAEVFSREISPSVLLFMFSPLLGLTNKHGKPFPCVILYQLPLGTVLMLSFCCLLNHCELLHLLRVG
jgi:hypothetical protein